MFYNIIKGENTVLRGLIAEEFARYILSQRFPILVIRPSTALRYLENTAIKGKNVDFLRKNQKTMDFLGIIPFFKSEELQLTPEETVNRFFYEKEGLNRYLKKEIHFNQLRGFIIEVKSRTTTDSWAPFQFTFSPNQREMLDHSRKFDFDIILCGVTFSSDWNLSVVFCDRQQKIISEDFYVINQ
ncbi:MAG: hypothetical protein JSU57_06620 [Candidatus Heimdallarchaeota archaeon]|nr:MAG: hypothetical protein JSU57_06620 [Candidatus Heimdallarchaeota archaeon]